MATSTRQHVDIENWLTSRFVEYEFFDDVNTSRFNRDESLRNQARFEPLNTNTVNQYAEAMVRGDIFPAVVAYAKANGELVVVDGNHRFEANDRVGNATIATYIVNAEPETLRVLTFEANTKHGLMASNEERLRQAIFLVDNNYTQEEAAATLRLTRAQISRAVQVERAERRARRANAPSKWTQLSNDTKLRFNRLHSDPVFLRATRLVIDAHLGNADAENLVKAVQALTNEKDQLQYLVDQVDVMRVSIQQRGGGAKKRIDDPRRLCLLHLGFFDHMDIDATLNSVLTREQQIDLYHKTMGTLQKLIVLAERLEPSSD